MKCIQSTIHSDDFSDIGMTQIIARTLEDDDNILDLDFLGNIFWADYANDSGVPHEALTTMMMYG